MLRDLGNNNGVVRVLWQLAQSPHSCAYVGSCPGLCVPDCLDLEFLLCNMALLWAVGSEQGLGPPEMESVLSAPPPTGVHRQARGGGHAG